MGSQNAQSRFWWGMAGGPMSLAIWPMIFRLLDRWPTGKKFQTDHCRHVKMESKRSPKDKFYLTKTRKHSGKTRKF